MTKRTWRSLLVAASLLAGTSAAAMPNHVTYTGELMADNGLPYTGAVSVTARLFAAASGGTAAWQQDLGSVSVMGGVLQIDLMDSNLMGTLAAAGDLWLEFEIDGETLSPRQKLSAAPYAMIAGNASMLGGMPASSYLTTDGLEQALDADNLPTDGINQVSNGSLRNEFMDVNAAWLTGPVPIPDYHPPTPGLNALASVTTQEGPGSYLTGIVVYTGFTLSALSDVTMRLFPPAGSGVGPITLRDEVLTPGGSPYNQSWNVSNTPELAALLGKEVAGEWVLTITDNDDTLTSTTSVGQLVSFEIAYDVVRANHLMVDGRLDVSGEINTATLNAETVNAGDLRPDKTTYPDGTVRYKAPRIARSIQNINGCNATNGVQRTLTINLDHEAVVFVTASGIWRGASGASSDLLLRIDGNAGDRLYHNDGSVWSSATMSWAGTLSAGTHNIDIFSTSNGVGGCNDYGSIQALIFE